jgi:ribosomal protein S18 acetylase RimI-like enzyme
MKGAKFETEQQKMQQKKALPDISTECIELLSEQWEDQYCMLHRKETYWTAERILTAQARFRVLLAIRDGQVQGYLDVTRCYEENEIYDLFVKPESAQQGYGPAMLVKAAELNRPHQMMVLVDVDAEEEIQLYTEAGFEVCEGYNSVLASYQIR